MVVVGGGFGGVRVVRALARADADITVVDRTNHHLFQPLLYQVATGILPDGLIAPALRSVLRKQANARVVLAEAQHLDLDRRVVHALSPDGQKLRSRTTAWWSRPGARTPTSGTRNGRRWRPA